MPHTYLQFMLTGIITYIDNLYFFLCVPSETKTRRITLFSCIRNLI